MTRYILDTNHLTAYQFVHPNLMDRINAVGLQNLCLTVVTVEEQTRGWLNAIKQASQSPLSKRAGRVNWAYTSLRLSVQMMNTFEILDFSIAAYDRCVELRRQGIRIATADLRIAAIALETGAIVATQNRRDFEQIPGLKIEDWLA